MQENKIVKLYKLFEAQEMNLKEIRQLRTYQDEDIDLILNSKYPRVMMDIVLNYEFKLLDNETKEKIIYLINTAKNEDIASYIYHIVRSKTILSSGRTYELSKIVYDSELISAMYVKEASLHVNVLLNKDSNELLKTIASSKTSYQASCASDIATNIEVLMSEKALELTNIASKTETEEQALLVADIAKNRDVLSSEYTIKLVKLASYFNLSNSLQIISSIALSKILEKNKATTYYLTRMLSTNNEEERLRLYNEAQKEINHAKEQESKLKKENNFFWTMYKDNPQDMIKILNESGTRNITPYTRVKKI